MAIYAKVNSLAFKVVFVLLSFCFLCETVIRSKDGCIVCGKKSQNIPFRSSASYFCDLEACFGFNPIYVNAEDICEGCRRAVHEYRSTGKTFHHVSVSCHFLFSRKHFTTVRLTYAKLELKLVKKPSINKLHYIKRVFMLYIFALLCPEE